MPKGKPAAFPNHRQLRHWERVCRYLDSQPHCAVSHPLPDEPPMSVKLFRNMAGFDLVRHYDSDCTYRLSKRWESILKRLWDCAPDDEQPESSKLRDDPFIADKSVDTMYVSLLTEAVEEWDEDDDEDHPERRLPDALADYCTQLKELAQVADEAVETPWQAFGAPLNMWKSGVGTSGKGKGVSWSFLLRNSWLMIRLRRTPLNRLLVSARLSAEALWTYGPISALDETYNALKVMWGNDEFFNTLTWQLSQIHLCVDVANFTPQAIDLDRVVTYSRKRAIHVPSLDDEDTPLPIHEDIDDYLLDQVPEEWGDLPDAFFLDNLDLSLDDEGDEESEETDDSDDDESPADEGGAAVYLYGHRASGFAFSASAPISAAWYNKELEERMSGKATWMRPIHEAGGWRPGMPLFRVEFRLMREFLREVGHSLPPGENWTDNPWLALCHLNDLWAYAVGLPPEHDHAPDATHRGWMRLAVPQAGDSNRSRWPTDPIWHIIQRADFGQANAPIPLQRSKITVHDPDAINAQLYGLFRLRSVIYGRQMDETLTLSQELEHFAETMAQWDAIKNRDYFKEVRTKARSLGRSVPLRADMILPFRPQQHDKHA